MHLTWPTSIMARWTPDIHTPPQVDFIDDVIESETSYNGVRSGVLLAVAVAAVLLVGIFGPTRDVFGRLHVHIGHPSDQSKALSVRRTNASCQESEAQAVCRNEQAPQPKRSAATE